jgi:hypothetical protein
MKNGKPIDWEARLARLESDMQELKRRLDAQQPQGWKAVVGTFANDPVFEEILRLGNAVREKERQQARRKSKKKASV